MEIKKTYEQINPDLLFDEIRDLAVKQGAVVGETRIQTYSMATDSSSFITRGTLTLKIRDEASKTEKECCQIHLVGSARGQTKLMMDIDEKLFPLEKVNALQSDFDFMFSSFEVTPQ
jgi:hypothetical protein